MPRVKDLDGLYIRIFAPPGGLAFGHRTAARPFGVAAGRDALGPEFARRVRGEMDHETVRIIPPYHVVDTVDLAQPPKISAWSEPREQMPWKNRPPHDRAGLEMIPTIIRTDPLDRQIRPHAGLLDANGGPILGARPYPHDVPFAHAGN